MHTLVFRFCNLLVAEAYRALLHLQKSRFAAVWALLLYCAVPGLYLMLRGGIFLRQIRGRCHYTVRVVRFFRLQMLAFGRVFEALSGEVILSGIPGYCFRGI